MPGRRLRPAGESSYSENCSSTSGSFFLSSLALQRQILFRDSAFSESRILSFDTQKRTIVTISLLQRKWKLNCLSFFNTNGTLCGSLMENSNLFFLFRLNIDRLQSQPRPVSVKIAEQEWMFLSLPLAKDDGASL